MGHRLAPGVLDAPPGAEAAFAPLATHAKVNIMVCTVETRGLDDAGTRRRLNKQPDDHHHFDARR